MTWIKVAAGLLWLGAGLSLAWPRDPSLLRIRFLNVGEGDATLIVAPGGATILVDAGPGGAERSYGGEQVLKAMRAMGVNHIDLFVWTHPQADHIGGAEYVLEHARVRMVLEPGMPYASGVYERSLTAVKNHGAKWVKAMRGQRVDFGDGLKATVLNPGHEAVSDINEASVTLRLTYRDVAVVLPGDAGVEAEGNMLGAGGPLQADLLKAGHHGSRTACSDAWLAAVNPRSVVISCGADNRFGHPSEETMEKLRRRDINVYRTDRDGTIDCLTDGRSFSFRLSASR